MPWQPSRPLPATPLVAIAWGPLHGHPTCMGAVPRAAEGFLLLHLPFPASSPLQVCPRFQDAMFATLSSSDLPRLCLLTAPSPHGPCGTRMSASSRPKAGIAISPPTEFTAEEWGKTKAVARPHCGREIDGRREGCGGGPAAKPQPEVCRSGMLLSGSPAHCDPSRGTQLCLASPRLSLPALPRPARPRPAPPPRPRPAPARAVTRPSCHVCLLTSLAAGPAQPIGSASRRAEPPAPREERAGRAHAPRPPRGPPGKRVPPPGELRPGGCVAAAARTRFPGRRRGRPPAM